MGHMKRFACIVVVILLSVPAWPAGKKITVAELTTMLKSLQQQKKSDAEVASALKQAQLSEQLSHSTMNGLADYVPGQLTTEQLYVM